MENNIHSFILISFEIPRLTGIFTDVHPSKNPSQMRNLKRYEVLYLNVSNYISI